MLVWAEMLNPQHNECWCSCRTIRQHPLHPASHEDDRSVVHSKQAHKHVLSDDIPLSTQLHLTFRLALLTAEQGVVFKEVLVTVTVDWPVIFHSRQTAGWATATYAWPVTFVSYTQLDERLTAMYTCPFTWILSVGPDVDVLPWWLRRWQIQGPKYLTWFRHSPLWLPGVW